MNRTLKNGVMLAIALVMLLAACSKKDETAPTITILGDNPMKIAIGAQNFADPGATAVDDTDGDLTNEIDAVSTVNVDLKGNYSIIYTVSDAEGNMGEALRYVFVINQSEYLIGPWSVTDNKIGPGGTPVQTSYQDIIITDDTLNNRYWVSLFGNNLNAKVYFDRVSPTQCQIPQQEMTCGTPPSLHRFFGSATVVDTNQIIVNYTEIIGTSSYTGSATYVR